VKTSEDPVRCPKCGSGQIHAEKRGWRWTSGFIGSRKIVITCLKCGKRFRPGITASKGGHRVFMAGLILLLCGGTAGLVVALLTESGHEESSSISSPTPEPNRPSNAVTKNRRKPLVPDEGRKAARQVFVDEAESRFGDIRDIHAIEENDTIVLNAPFFGIENGIRTMSMDWFSQAWQTRFDDDDRLSMCQVGLRGVKFRDGPADKGVFVSSKCARR
jgi:hypothetical protein